MASKGLLAVLGLVGVGAFALTRKAKAVIPDEQIEFPEDDEPISDPEGDEGPAGSAGGNVPSGSGEPEFFSFLPEELRNIQLSGNEQLTHIGVSNRGPEQIPFRQWTITDSLNDMDIQVFRSVDSPDNWIAYFWKVNPNHFRGGNTILYKISPLATEAMQDWMTRNIAKIDS
jgi:hypothetical protein